MSKTLALLTLTLLLGACGGDGGGGSVAGNDPPGGAGGGETGEAPVNDHGVVASSDDGPLDITVENDENLGDEPVTEGLLAARRTIVGDWVLLDGATQCVTALRFDERRRFRQTSLDEVSAGTYTVYLDAEDDDASLSLILEFEEDNELPDCAGDNTSSAGRYFDTYLSFRSPDRMRFSEAPGGFGNHVEFERRN